jgi:site-specific recombinase XerD
MSISTQIQPVPSPKHFLEQIREVSLNRHPVVVYLARLSPGSVRTMLGALNTMADILSSGRYHALTLDWSQITHHETDLLASQLRIRYAPATVNKFQAALKGCLKQYWRSGLMSDPQYHRAIDLPSARGTSPPKGRALREDEIQTLFAYCAGDTPCQIRDRALLAILYGGGLRRAETAAAMVEDYDPSTGALTIMHGKGDKYRIVYLAGNLHLSLVRWLDLRSHIPGPLLLRVKGGRVLPQGITPQAILKILQRLASKTDVEIFSPHDLRRTFITELISRGGDLFSVQGLAGHADVKTTARYDRRGEEAKRKTAALLDV